MSDLLAIETIKIITLIKAWLDNLEIAIGTEALLDAMPNNFGGRQDLQKILNELTQALQKSGDVKRGMANQVLIRFFKQEAQRYRIKWMGYPDHIYCWPVGSDRISLHLLGYEEDIPRNRQDLCLLAPPILLHLTPQSWKDELPFPKVKFIDWKSRGEPIGMGGLAVVYRVTPGVVAKVGRIDFEEVQAQSYFSRRQKAVPVWDFEEDYSVPSDVANEVCAVHGIRPKEGILDPDQNFCTCFGGQDVLLMPEADDCWIDPKSMDVQAFKLGFSAECEQELGRHWDARPNNVARYLGNLVALDFGEEEMLY